MRGLYSNFDKGNGVRFQAVAGCVFLCARIRIACSIPSLGCLIHTISKAGLDGGLHGILNPAKPFEANMTTSNQTAARAGNSSTKQPVWKLIAQLGDVHPIEYGGHFVFIDETGVYDPEAEILQANDDGTWTAYRYSLDKCTLINGILSDNKFHPEIAAWFAHKLSSVAECCDYDTLAEDLCGENVVNRALAYDCIGNYFGFDNLDSYPLTFTDRAEVEARYSDCKYQSPAR